MKSTLKWGGICLVIFFVFLVVKLPAIQVLPKLQLPPEVQISGVSGTIWNGHAQRVSYQGFPLEKVDWSLSFLSLLLNNISLQVKAGSIRQADQLAINGHIEFSGNQVKADKLQVYVPADLVLMSLPLPIPISAEGRFKVVLDTLDYDFQTGCHTLDGKGQWLNAKVAGVGNTIDLGNFAGTLACEDKQVLLNVKEPNSFGLNAQANISANMKFKINGRFKPSPELPKEVHQAASFFGQPGKDGYYPIKF